LKPFNLNDREKFFTWRQGDVDALVARNEDLTDGHFYKVTQDRPYLLVGSSLLTKRMSPKGADIFRIVLSPLYSGVPDLIVSKRGGKIRRLTGGGFLETAGFDMIMAEHPPARQGGAATLEKPDFGGNIRPNRLRFTLSDMAASTGAAPQQILRNIPLANIVFGQLGLPEHYIPLANVHAPIVDKEFDACKAAVEKLDGTESSLNGFQSEREHCEKMVGDDIASLFIASKKLPRNVSLRLKIKGRSQSELLSFKAGYEDILKVADTLRMEKTSVMCEDYIGVIDNHSKPKHELKLRGNYRPKICFVWLNQHREWFDSVLNSAKKLQNPSSAIELIKSELDYAEGGKFRKRRASLSKGFPYLGTFFDKPIHFIDVSKLRSLALSNYTAWVLKKNKDILLRALQDSGVFKTSGVKRSPRIRCGN